MKNELNKCTMLYYAKISYNVYIVIYIMLNYQRGRGNQFV